MINRTKNLSARLSQSLGFVPGVVVLLFAAMGILVVEVDHRVDLDGVGYVFQGDESAARTVLQVIAGSLITVAGLTFSITMVVLQLASSQFSPRVLRSFFTDRVTQLTIGTFVGVFVYALVVLRTAGSLAGDGSVPRLGVTVASVLAIGAVILLILFLNHVSSMIQVSAVTAGIAHETLGRLEALYPERYGVPEHDDEAERDVLARWREEPSGKVYASRPGYVQRVGVDDVVGALSEDIRRIGFPVRPGDFVSVEMPIAEVWPAEAAEAHEGALRGAVALANERTLDQDVDFGLRQLTDIALRAISPAVNDPMTAVTCIGYLRSILVRLTERAAPDPVRRFDEHDLAALAPARRYDEYLDVVLQLNRYVAGDAWVAGELLETLAACDGAARGCGATDRRHAIRAVAEAVIEQTLADVGNGRDRERIERLGARLGVAVAQDLL